MSLGGDTIEGATVRDWLKRNLPKQVIDLAGELIGEGARAGPDWHPDALLDLLQDRKVVPLDEAVRLTELVADKIETSNPNMPLVDFKKEGLFDPNERLFPDMIAGNYEEWTVYNRSFSDHPFHIHQNHFLVTKINGIALPRTEWHDTLIVPSALCLKPSCPALQPTGPLDPHHTNLVNINDATPGSITYRTYLNPITAGCFVMHCHTLNHEDIGMMQRVDILPGKGQFSGCMPESH